MQAPLLIVAATLLFSIMGVCVKLASADYTPAEIVLYRGLVGMVLLGIGARLRGGTFATAYPAAHFWRSLTGVLSLGMWFYAIGRLPLATAVTLNYMSSVWMALFLLGGSIVAGGRRVDPRLIATVLAGFLGVACVLRPTLGEQQAWAGLMGLLSGMLAATAYLQVASLGRLGEPEYRVVFYFAVGGVGAGALGSMLTGGFHAHTARGLALLLAVGVLATAAQLSLTRAYALGRPLVSASLQYLGIAWAFLIGVIAFDEPVTPLALLGMLLIVGAGLAAVRLRQGSAAPAADSAAAAAPAPASVPVQAAAPASGPGPAPAPQAAPPPSEVDDLITLPGKLDS